MRKFNANHPDAAVRRIEPPIETISKTLAAMPRINAPTWKKPSEIPSEKEKHRTARKKKPKSEKKDSKPLLIRLKSLFSNGLILMDEIPGAGR